MTDYIGLLRAVNLPGHNRVAMAALRELLLGLELAEPRTLLQSGNFVFSGDARSPAVLERLLEAEAVRRLDVSTDFFIRTAEQWAEIVAGNPFPAEARRDPGRMVVMVLKARPSAEALRELPGWLTGPELVRVQGRHGYIVYPGGIGRSRLTAPLLEKRLGTRGTGRNWNTVLKLAAMVGI
jgi:uncharacterized protein (DUF1697 family)